MSEIKLDTAVLHDYANRIARLRTRMYVLDERMNILYQNSRLTALQVILYQGIIASERAYLYKVYRYLENTKTDFERLEERLTYANYKKSVSGLNGWLKELYEALFPNSSIIDESKSVLEKFWDGELKFTDVFVNPEKGWYEDDNNFGGEDIVIRSFFANPEIGKFGGDDWLGDKDHLDLNIEQKKKDWDKINKGKDEDWYDKDATLLEAKFGSKYEESQWGYHVGNDEGDHFNVDLGYVEGHMDAGFGFYVYSKDEDGNIIRKVQPSMFAEIGGCVAAFRTDMGGKLGTDMFNIHGNLEATAFSAEGTAKFALKSDEVYAKISAEADLFKISGAAGVTVLGTELDVTGSLKVGFGGHADVGYTDGVLKVDIGAALGVGFDLGFEVDVEKTVDTVFDTCEAVVDGIIDVGEDVWEGVMDVGGKIADFFDFF